MDNYDRKSQRDFLEENIGYEKFSDLKIPGPTTLSSLCC